MILAEHLPDNPAAEWKTRRTFNPPYWCVDCQVGQSIEHCWLCAQPCQKTTTTPTPVFASAMWWEPGPGRTGNLTEEAA